MTFFSFLFLLLFVLYALTFIIYLLTVKGKAPKQLKADLLFEIAFLLHTFFIFSEAREANIYLPITTFKEALVFFAWALAFVYVVLLRRVKHEMFGLILLPFLLLFLGVSSLVDPGKVIPSDYLNSHYFLIHILSIFVSYASFALSCTASVLYLIQAHALKSKQLGTFYHELPPLRELEKFIFYSVAWGFCLLGAGILSGALWSKSVFHTFIVREPKAAASMVTWIVYGIVFWLHHKSVISGRRSVLYVLYAFGLVLFTFLGTSFLQTKLHVGI